MTSRRQFLATTATAALGIPVLLAAPPGSETGPSTVKPVGEPRFRFLQVNDTHYQSPQAKVISPTYTAANGRVHWWCDAIRSGGIFPPVDFVLHLGDMTHQHSQDRRQELRAFKALLDTLPIPTYTVVGNHDNVQGEGDGEKEAPYREVFGEHFDYAFTHKGLGFVVVDTSGTGMPTLRAERVRRRRERLQGHLAGLQAQPVIVCSHIPLVPMREQPVLAKSFGFISHFVREPDVLEVVKSHREQVVAVLSGHLHLSGVVWDDGIAHIDVCGTASYPHDLALHTVYENCLVTRLVRMPSTLLEPSTNIHGAHRHGLDFIDASHDDYTRYLMGNAEERDLVIPFRRPLSS